MLDLRLNNKTLCFRSITRNLLFLFFMLFCLMIQAQVKTSIDTTIIRIGEEIKYTLEVEADTTALVLFPEGQSFQPLEMIDSYPVDTIRLDSKLRLIKKYGITQFDSGSYKLPGQRVMIDDRAFLTDSALVEVRDVPVDTTQQKMFDIKPVVDVERPPFDFTALLYWLLAILLVGGAVYFLFRRKKLKEERERQLPPYEEAMVALEQLDASEYLKENRSKAYYSSLTEIVKRYIDREVDDTALESTSDELIERLQLHKDSGHFDFDTETIKKLDSILKRADLVKFAKMQQELGQARADRSTIEEIINETKEALPEPTEEELLENEAYLEQLAKKRKRKRWIQGIAMGIGVLLIGAAVYGTITGFDNLKDKVLGNEMRELTEGRWYKSEYGNPAVIVETPEILVRKEMEIPEEIRSAVLSSSFFEFGQLDKGFHISVMSASYDRVNFPEPENALDAALENVLSTLEQNGALNLIVKKEQFSTEKGIEGLKAHGEFNLKNSKGKIFKEKIAYETLLFKQNQGLQYVSVVYLKDNFYASEIRNRIVNSVELEVDPTQGSLKKEE